MIVIGTVSCDTVRFSRCPRRVDWPRRGEPWTPAEDERLLQLVKAAMARNPDVPIYSYRSKGPAFEVARALGRTPSAIQTRYQTLMVCRKRGC